MSGKRHGMGQWTASSITSGLDSNDDRQRGHGMSDDLMERYGRAVQQSDEAERQLSLVVEAASDGGYGCMKHPEFAAALRSRDNKAIREAGIAREVIAALQARVAELETELESLRAAVLSYNAACPDCEAVWAQLHEMARGKCKPEVDG